MQIRKDKARKNLRSFLVTGSNISNDKPYKPQDVLGVKQSNRKIGRNPTNGDWTGEPDSDGLLASVLAWLHPKLP